VQKREETPRALTFSVGGVVVVVVVVRVDLGVLGPLVDGAPLALVHLDAFAQRHGRLDLGQQLRGQLLEHRGVHAGAWREREKQRRVSWTRVSCSYGQVRHSTTLFIAKQEIGEIVTAECTSGLGEEVKILKYIYLDTLSKKKKKKR